MLYSIPKLRIREILVMKFISEYLESFQLFSRTNDSIENLKDAISKGIDVNNFGPFVHPLGLSNYEETQILIEAGIEIKGLYEERILFESINSGELLHNYGVIQKKMDLLIANGLDINLKNSNNENILFACRSREVFLYFLDKIEDIFLLNNNNENIAFHITRQQWYADDDIIFKDVLENRGLNLSQINNDNQNLLFFVRNLEFLKHLINKGLDVNISDSKGNTPLMSCRCDDIAMKLIENGADIHKKNNKGKNALNSLFGYERITKKLMQENIELINFPEDFIYKDGDFDTIKSYHSRMIEAEKEMLKRSINKKTICAERKRI